MSSGTIHDFTLKTIDGEERSLKDYAGKVLLVVNVASECGLTPQYADLQSLHEEYAEHGFEVLGFPCNQFGGQEPGSDADVKAFCSTKYGVGFPMFSNDGTKLVWCSNRATPEGRRDTNIFIADWLE